MKNTLTYNGISPNQASNIDVFCFVAKAGEIQQFALIERASRDQAGTLSGFQRPQIANHIKEIKDYLQSENAILPNPIVVAFTQGVTINTQGGVSEITIDVSSGAPGWIVDGQQRYSALLQLEDKDFDVVVSAFHCRDDEELHKQFILINNTRPLPKSLIYELLPKVKDLPNRLSSRSLAAEIVELLNFRDDSVLKGKIKQQTNPDGVITDTAIQKVIMNSLSDGALRLMFNEEHFKDKAFTLLNNFFSAVINVFPEAWHDQKPKTSRLVHMAGINSMGYVMEALFSIENAREIEEFEYGLERIKPITAWTSGNWEFAPDDSRKWNSIQGVARDVRQLADFLIRELKRSKRRIAC